VPVEVESNWKGKHLIAIVDGLLRGDRILFLEALENSLEPIVWREACDLLIKSGHALINHENTQSLFLEFGHRVREKIADDRLMATLLRRLMPPFTGDGKLFELKK
jgi:hypothetical protein